MSKIVLTFATFAACLACAAFVVPALAAKDDKPDVASTLSAKYKEAGVADPYGKSKFKGKVGPEECAKNRTVRIKGYGNETTNRKGKFLFELTGPASPDRYKVKVAAKGDCKKVKERINVS